MIPVELAPEPAEFDARVRRPGAEAARRKAAGETDELAPHWTRCLPDMLAAYGRICAYACLRIPEITGNATVEHFEPKSKRPELAYEWSNFRLVCGLMNARKRDFEDVLDPVGLEEGLFALDLVSLTVVPGPAATGPKRAQVLSTIRRLGLDREDYAQALRAFYQPFLTEHEIPPAIRERQLRHHAPFLAREHARQAG